MDGRARVFAGAGATNYVGGGGGGWRGAGGSRQEWRAAPEEIGKGGCGGDD